MDMDWPEFPGYTPPPQMYWKRRSGRFLVLIYMGLLALIAGAGIQWLVDPDLFVTLSGISTVLWLLYIGGVVLVVWIFNVIWIRLIRGSRTRSGSLSAYQQLQLEAGNDPEKIREAIGSAFGVLKATIVEEGESESGWMFVIGKKGFTWKSFGERLDVLWQKRPVESEKNVALLLASTPKLTTTTMDWGCAHDNLATIRKELQMKCPANQDSLTSNVAPNN